MLIKTSSLFIFIIFVYFIYTRVIKRMLILRYYTSQGVPTCTKNPLLNDLIEINKCKNENTKQLAIVSHFNKAFGD